jgi:hypothetical protein
MGIQTLYRNPANYNRMVKEDGKGFLSAHTWDSMLGEFLPKILGDAARGDGPLIPDVVTDWWQATVQSLLDAASKQRARCEAGLAKMEKVVENLFGPNWLKAEIPVGFTLTKARSALKTLKGFKAQLAWQLVSKKDVEIMQLPLEVNGPDGLKGIQSRWEQLTPNARKMEFCQVAIGWMMGVVGAKTGVEVEDDESVDFGGEQDEALCTYNAFQLSFDALYNLQF